MKTNRLFAILALTTLAVPALIQTDDKLVSAFMDTLATPSPSNKHNDLADNLSDSASEIPRLVLEHKTYSSIAEQADNFHKDHHGKIKNEKANRALRELYNIASNAKNSCDSNLNRIEDAQKTIKNIIQKMNVASKKNADDVNEQIMQVRKELQQSEWVKSKKSAQEPAPKMKKKKSKKSNNSKDSNPEIANTHHWWNFANGTNEADQTAESTSTTKSKKSKKSKGKGSKNNPEIANFGK